MSGGARGSFLLYALAFGLFVGAGAALVIAAIDLLSSPSTLWTSVVLSALAVACAVAGLLMPRRR